MDGQRVIESEEPKEGGHIGANPYNVKRRIRKVCTSRN